LGERLRKAIAGRTFEHEGRQIPVTISVGCAVRRTIEDPLALVAAADAAMYEAKRAGRNQVVLAE
jgi:diguanylate cyclase (GGDEF)-like protein